MAYYYLGKKVKKEKIKKIHLSVKEKDVKERILILIWIQIICINDEKILYTYFQDIRNTKC